MKKIIYIISFVALVMIVFASSKSFNEVATKSAKDILGNPEYLAISYGGYRAGTRDVQPTIPELKEDMKLLAAMGIGIIRTYNVQLAQAENLLEAIAQLKNEDQEFEMYVMLGAWIDCENAWTPNPNHDAESQANAGEIDRAVALAKRHPDIVKIIAVGNEAMVHWAQTYFVRPNVILKWVNYLQGLKQKGELAEDLWITTSDNFAAWGGSDEIYHTPDLEKLIAAVDYVSMHTYPFHETHYKSEYFKVPENEETLSEIEKIDTAMLRAKNFARSEYNAVKNHLAALRIDKPIHIGETGWASSSDGFYGDSGSHAADQYKQGLFYKHIRDWTNAEGISCFYFEAFDEHWKDDKNPEGSENHFGLFEIDGQAKYALWDLVDEGVFEGLTRNNKPVVKTYDGNKDLLLKEILAPKALVETEKQ